MMNEELKPTKIFIAGSREISPKRILDLVKNYIKRGPITWGVFEEEFIEGFEGQLQFRNMEYGILNETIEKIKSKVKLPNSIEILKYSQKDQCKIFDELDFQKIVLINGSWKIVFHRRPEFEILEKKKVSISFKSPFVDEEEAKAFALDTELGIRNKGEHQGEDRKKQRDKIENVMVSQSNHDSNGSHFDMLSVTERDNYFLNLADEVAKRSFDYTWQTGAVLLKDGEVIASGHNRILPYETYAMHHGSVREQKRSEFNDLNNYDTIHAEMDLLSEVIRKQINIENSTLYIDLLPCPNCARALASSGIKTVVYRKGHFGDYAKELFESMGIEVKKSVV